MKSILAGLFYLVAYFVFTFALMYFMSYIVYDVSHLYSIPYLMNFTVGNFFGFWFVYQLITSKNYKSKVIAMNMFNRIIIVIIMVSVGS